MIAVAIIASLTAIVLGGTWMGLRFAKEYDPELLRIQEEKEKASKQIPDTSSECVEARNKAYKAVDESTAYPSISRKTVKTQVQLFPQAFNEEERKRLIKWANEP